MNTPNDRHSETGAFQNPGLVPEEFVEQVKEALENLYNYPYLQRHPLASKYAAVSATRGETPGQWLRSELLSTIELLSLGPDVPFRAPHARQYQLLHLHYIEGLSIQDTANELGLSERQAYRDLRKGEESVASILWTRFVSNTPPKTGVQLVTSVESEMERWELHVRLMDLQPLLQHIQQQEAIVALAARHQITLQLEPFEPVSVYTDPSVAQQVLISIFSWVIQQASPGICRIHVDSSEEGARVSLSCGCTSIQGSNRFVPHTISVLTERLGWSIEQPAMSGALSVKLRITSPVSAILVIDDNEGLGDLVKHYLAGEYYRVVAATSGEQGLQVAQNLSPKAILLDIMMPTLDGWEVLQMLQMHPKTASIPVIICSVFNDPELAYSAGASGFLPKPLRREELVDALHQVGVG